MTNRMRPSLYHLVEGNLSTYHDQADRFRFEDAQARQSRDLVAPTTKREIQFSNLPFERSFRFDAFEQTGAIARLAGCISRSRGANEALLKTMGFKQDRHGTWLHSDGSFLTFEKNGISVANAGRIRDYDPSQRQFPQRG